MFTRREIPALIAGTLWYISVTEPSGLIVSPILSGLLLNAISEPFVQANPASKKMFKSENSILEGIKAKRSGPANGNLTSKLATAIRVPIN
jgi:hypothetical protein